MRSLTRGLRRVAVEASPHLWALLSPAYWAARSRDTEVLRGPDAADWLAPFVRDATFELLAPPVVERCKHLLLDTLACVYIGMHAPNGTVMHRLATRADTAATGCTLIGSAAKVACADAIFTHAALSQVFDGNDGWENPLAGGSYHPGRVIVPVCLSLGEELACSGRDLLVAQAVGYEVTRRTRSSLGRSASDLLGATCAAAKLLHLSDRQIAHALSLADLHGPSVIAGPSNFAFDANHLSTGYIARAALEAAQQAQSGMTAPPLRSLIELTVPRAGRKPPFDAVLSTYIKPYPVCRYLHGAIDGVIAFKAAEDWPVSQIGRVQIKSPGADFIAAKTTPETSVKRCQFSLPYAVACILLDGQLGTKQFHPDRIAASDIQEVQQLITTKVVRPASRGGAPRGTRIEIHHRDGRVYTRSIDRPKGGSRNPLNRQELIDKFDKWTGDALPIALKRHITEMVLDLDDVKDVRALACQLGGRRAAAKEDLSEGAGRA